MHHYYRTVLFAGLLVLLTACGFQLRGDFQLAEHLSPVYLDPRGNIDLRNELRVQLVSNKVVLTADENNAASRLSVNNVKRSRRVISVDSRGRAREYEVDYTVQYSFKYGDAQTIEREAVFTRELLFDPDSVLAIGNEIAMLYQDMKQDAARVIMQQLQAVK